MVWKVAIGIVLVTAGIAFLVQSTMTRTQIYSISRAKAADSLGGTVAVQGKIVSANNNVFILQDETGKIEVDTCPTWYKRLDLYAGDEVMVIGQVANNPSEELKTNYVLNAYKIVKGKQVITVRGRPGKPPWMYYRAPDDAPAS